MVTKTSGKIKIKPVESSEIKDPKIIRDVIAEIHRKPTPEDWAYVKEREEMLKRMMAK